MLAYSKTKIKIIERYEWNWKEQTSETHRKRKRSRRKRKIVSCAQNFLAYVLDFENPRNLSNDKIQQFVKLMVCKKDDERIQSN